jgi:aconitate hydratase
MGILPLQFADGKNAEVLNLTGEESFEITGIKELIDNYKPGAHLKVKAKAKDGTLIQFDVLVRLDTPQEALYYRHGGIMQYVIRQLLKKNEKPAALKPSGTHHNTIAA